jgi:hypothetical protein
LTHDREQKYIQEKDELPDGTVKVISNWKMKILACYFRKNQGKFFGKSGTSLLGFMVIANSTNPEDRHKGTNDIQFMMMMMTNDLL